MKTKVVLLLLSGCLLALAVCVGVVAPASSIMLQDERKLALSPDVSPG